MITYIVYPTSTWKENRFCRWKSDWFKSKLKSEENNNEMWIWTETIHSTNIIWKKLEIGILIMRVKITKSYTVILENWYLQLLIQYLLKEKVIDKCFCGFGWCPLSVTWCDHIHHSPTRSPASSSSQDPPKEMEEEEKTHNLPYITRRVSSRDCQLLAWRFRLPFRSIFCASVSVWVLR